MGTLILILALLLITVGGAFIDNPIKQTTYYTTTKCITSRHLQLYPTLDTSLLDFVRVPIKQADHWILPIIRDNPANSAFEVLLSGEIIVGFRVLTKEEINNLLNK